MRKETLHDYSNSALPKNNLDIIVNAEHNKVEKTKKLHTNVSFSLHFNTEFPSLSHLPRHIIKLSPTPFLLIGGNGGNASVL